MTCRHKWVETARRYTPLAKAWIQPRKATLLLVMGVTVIELRCGKCGDVRSRELAGDAR